MNEMLRFLLVVLLTGCVVAAKDRNERNAQNVPNRNQKNDKRFMKGLMTFSTKLYTELAKEKRGENMIFSPFSIESALLMTAIGARNNTKKEIRAAMEMGTLRPLRNMTKRFRKKIERLQDGYFFETANRIFYQNGSIISKDYVTKAEEVVGSSPQGLDFAGRPDLARDVINRWVEKKTKNKIKDLIPEGVINELVRVILVNAVYFKADWETKFNQSLTMPFKFMGHGGETDVDMMEMVSKFRYKEDFECEGYKVLEMPYKGGKMSMILVLPFEATENDEEFKEFESCIMGRMNKIIPFPNSNTKLDVHVNIPKFRLEQNFDLKQPLTRMRVRDLFVMGKANLRGMDPTGDLYVSDALHKAFIEVNEEGSEAAAATAMIFRGRSAFGGDPIIKQFVADHPFIFLIKHKTGGIIFMGRVTRP